MIYQTQSVGDRDPDTNEYSVTMFSETPNRRGDIVEVQGMDITGFQSNPVLMYNHAMEYNLPIGRVNSIEVKKSSIDAKFTFDMEDSFARQVADKFERGFLNAVSIGFQPQEMESVDPEAEGWDAIFGPQRFTKTDLVELSVTPTPKDATAVRKQTLESHYGAREYNQTQALPEQSIPDMVREILEG